MARLKSLQQDCTYDQTGGVKEFLKKNKDQFFSLDLESATDRFPAELQEKLLAAMLNNNDLAALYFRILKDYPFDSKLGKVSYAVGQPMGAYSS